ncbi:hypothetical protein RJT34_31459 [Clitoria ternatea]|uniref:Uncharacterized protein n=1 Tax=Clitoria ternatea TaxID=43366 RepID=A0AAN9I8E8_CLITE
MLDGSMHKSVTNWNEDDCGRDRMMKGWCRWIGGGIIEDDEVEQVAVTHSLSLFLSFMSTTNKTHWSKLS